MSDTQPDLSLLRLPRLERYRRIEESVRTQPAALPLAEIPARWHDLIPPHRTAIHDAPRAEAEGYQRVIQAAFKAAVAEATCHQTTCLDSLALPPPPPGRLIDNATVDLLTEVLLNAAEDRFTDARWYQREFARPYADGCMRAMRLLSVLLAAAERDRNATP